MGSKHSIVLVTYGNKEILNLFFLRLVSVHMYSTIPEFWFKNRAFVSTALDMDMVILTFHMTQVYQKKGGKRKGVVVETAVCVCVCGVLPEVEGGCVYDDVAGQGEGLCSEDDS